MSHLLMVNPKRSVPLCLPLRFMSSHFRLLPSRTKYIKDIYSYARESVPFVAKQ